MKFHARSGGNLSAAEWDSRRTGKARILVLGYGNPLRSDDGLGWRAAECVADILSDCDAEVHTLHQLTPELALPISRADRVIFIDAGREGEPGQLSCRQVVAQLKPVRFSHELSPDGLLAMAKHMFGETCPAFLVSVCGESFSLGERLSPLVAAQMPRVVSLVAQLVRSGLSSAGSPA